MRAMIINEYGPPAMLQKVEIEQPQAGPNQLLIEIRAAGVNPLDWKIRRGNFRLITGRRFPRILGSDIAGIVRETGKNSTGFQPGDAVIAMVNCITGQGGYAEFVAAGPKYTCRKPANISFVEAAALPGSGLTALQVLRRRLVPALVVHGPRQAECRRRRVQVPDA